MSNASSHSALEDAANVIQTDGKDFLTINVGGQIFGIPILQVQDVLGDMKVTRIPLAPPQVCGALNLRGRIVTAIDVRKCLGLPPIESIAERMSVVVTHDDELFSLVIDSVGDVLTLKDKEYEQNPATLDITWKAVSLGIYRLDGKILVILDIPKLLLALQRFN